MYCALNTQAQDRFTIWAKNAFYIVSKIYSFEARILEYDRKCSCGCGKERKCAYEIFICSIILILAPINLNRKKICAKKTKFWFSKQCKRSKGTQTRKTHPHLEGSYVFLFLFYESKFSSDRWTLKLKRLY